MKKYVFIITCIIATIAIGLFIGTRDNSVLPPQNDNKEPNSITPSKLVQSDTNTKPSVVSDELNIEIQDTEEVADQTEITDHTETSKKQERYDWLSDDDLQSAKQKVDDPFSVELAIQQAKADGTYIPVGDIRTMDPEFLYKARYNQNLKRFGDIPEVHTVMKYERKEMDNIRLTLDERIENLEAIVHLFPWETNKRTLAFHKWMRSTGHTPESIPNMSDSDIKHLRSLGITIEKEPAGDGGYHLKISTK